jgi:hypothetical protein
MATDEIETVLTTRFEQALSPIGRLPEGITPAAWVAANFAAWWRDRVRDAIGDADRAASAVREELMRLGGWETFGEALHEMIHLQDALGDLRGLMRLPVEPEAEAAGGPGPPRES